MDMIIVIVAKLKNMPYLTNCLKGLLLTFLIFSTIVFFILKASYASQLTFQNQTVNIQRDNYNIPSITAPSYRSMLYGWGYVTAEDRLFQITFRRCLLQGRLSQLFGENTLKTDIYFRELGFEEWAQKTQQKLKRENETEYDNMNAFADGINAYVESLWMLPIEFYFLELQWEQWKVADIFLLYKLIAYVQGNTQIEQHLRSTLLHKFSQEQVQELIPFEQKNYFDRESQVTIIKDHQLTPDQLKSHGLHKEPFTPFKVGSKEVFQSQFSNADKGSNSWVVSGNLTQSGAPILCNDPHLDSAAPNEWHQVRLEYTEKGKTYRSVCGASVGLPSCIGQTDYLSLAFTTLYSDIQDLYEETIKDEKYLFEGVWKPLKKRIETILTKNGSPINHTVYQTHRGPIMSYLGFRGSLHSLDKPISLAWVGFNDEYSSLIAYSHFAEINKYQDLLKFLQEDTDFGPSMNMLYATKDKHIGYQSVGIFPIHSNPISGMYVKNGSNGQHDWAGMIRGKERLHLEDPERGFIVTANNKPTSRLFQNGLYDYSMTTSRANRIEQLIEKKIASKTKFSMEDMMAIQMDTVDFGCKKIIPLIIQAVPIAADSLGSFDCDFHRDSYKATLYEVFFYQLFLLVNPFPTVRYNLLALQSFNQYLYKFIENAPTNASKVKIIEDAWNNTLTNLTQFFLDKPQDQWFWGDYHIDKLPHRPLSNSEILRSLYELKHRGFGNMNTVNVGMMGMKSYGIFDTTHRANIRTLLSLEETSYWIVDTGTSEKFFSKHYDDQMKLFMNGEYLPLRAREQEEL